MEKLELLRNAAALLGLTGAAVRDLRTRTIPLWIFMLMAVSGLVLHLLEGSLLSWDLLIGCLTGVVFFGISKLSREGIGYGDCLLILGMGLLLNPEILLTAGFSAFMAAGLAALVLFTVFHCKKELELPFAPFLLGGTVLAFFSCYEGLLTGWTL